MVKTLNLNLEEMTNAIINGLIVENKLSHGRGENINVEFNATRHEDTGLLELTGCTLKITK